MRPANRTSRNASRGRPRSGGRSARVRAAVFGATQELLQDRGAHGFSIVDVAERAGVAPSSLYRRWGGVEALIMDVGMDSLMQEYPLPETGSLHGDLKGWADNIVRSLRDPVAATFFRMLVSTAEAKGETAANRTKAIRRRRADLAKLVERARGRGERVPDVALLVDVILAPLYTRALFGERLEAGHARRLVARLMHLIENQR
jgi:AcrR family transcriptional regulator